MKYKTWSDGTKMMFIEGSESVLHYEDGPAVINPDGSVEYWILGEQVCENQFWNRTFREEQGIGFLSHD